MKTLSSEVSELHRSKLVLNFEDLNYKVGDKKILDGLNGEFKSGELVAMMGPSGAGKTSLMNVFTGVVTSHEGNFTVNGCRWHKDLRDIISFCPQHETFYPHVTVLETLQFTAKLRLPKSWSDEQKKRRVDDVIASLRLEHCTNQILGGEKNISGGEKKRVAVARELVSQPHILILDEPTSGLDSYSAQLLIEQLDELAKKSDILVIVSLHQPSLAVFSTFDKVVFLAKGKIMYQGATDKDLFRYLNAVGHPVPPGSSVSDHCLGLFSDDNLLQHFVDEYKKNIQYDSDIGFWCNPERQNVMQSRSTKIFGDWNRKTEPKPGPYVQFMAVFKRNLKSEGRRMWIQADGIELISLVAIQMLSYWGVYNENDMDIVTFRGHLGQVYGLCLSNLFRGAFAELFAETAYRESTIIELQSQVYSHGVYFWCRVLCNAIVMLPWPTVMFFVAWSSNGCIRLAAMQHRGPSWLLGWFGIFCMNLIGQKIGTIMGIGSKNFMQGCNMVISYNLFNVLSSGSFVQISNIIWPFSWIYLLSMVYYVVGFITWGVLGPQIYLQQDGSEIQGYELLTDFGFLEGAGVNLAITFGWVSLMLLIIWVLIRYHVNYNPR